MLNFTAVYLFIFYWSCLVLIRSVIVVMTSTFGKEPQPIRMSKTELFLNSLALSYIITYATL